MAVVDELLPTSWSWTGGAGEVSDETRFQAASISKVAAALVTFRLYDQGVIDVDADINAMLEPWDLRGGHRIKIIEVLSHTGGLNVPSIPGVDRRTEPPPDLWKRVSGGAGYERVASVEPPGSTWAYSGGGYALLQLALERVTGSPYEALLATELLKPLDLINTGAEPGVDYAPGHDAEGVGVPGGYCLYPELTAAGVWTTPTDLVRLWGAVVRPGYLTERSWAMLLKGRLSKRSIAGMVSGTTEFPQVWHDGRNNGYRAIVFGYLSEPHQVAAVMVSAEARDRVIDRALSLAADAFRWPDFEPPE
jgi:CubicO group peptidase (beta-lactamase class C family)